MFHLGLIDLRVVEQLAEYLIVPVDLLQQFRTQVEARKDGQHFDQASDHDPRVLCRRTSVEVVDLLEQAFKTHEDAYPLIQRELVENAVAQGAIGKWVVRGSLRRSGEQVCRGIVTDGDI